MKTVDGNFSEALGAYNSGNTQAVAELVKSIICEAGIDCRHVVKRAIGAWAYGACQGCVVSIDESMPPDQALRFGAKLGLATNSPHIMAFTSGSGSETLHYFETEITDHGKVRKALKKCKLVSYSIIPQVKKTIVLLHDPKSILIPNFEVLQQEIPGKHTIIKGKGQYLGSDASDEETARKKAKQAYRQALGLQSANNPDSGSPDPNKDKGEKSGKSKIQGAGRSSSKGSKSVDGLQRRPGTFKPKG